MLAAGLSLLLLGRRSGRSWPRLWRAGLALGMGGIVSTGLFLLDRLVKAPLPVIEIAEIQNPMMDWMDQKMPEGEAAPDFSLVDTRTSNQVSFSSLRGDRPAVLVFASFG
jgi:hypothetical protein